MRYAVISDVHGNLEALQAVIADIKMGEIKKILFLGDAVGYGPDPNECVDLLRNECPVMVAGNHDWAVLGLADIERFNPYARAAIEWTIKKIDRDARELLQALPLTRDVRRNAFFLVHATPLRPDAWHYLMTLSPEDNFSAFRQRVCFTGHTHIPVVIERSPSGKINVHRSNVTLEKKSRYIVNVGSVGQPRDGDPRACYAVVDENSVTFQRIVYPLEKTQRKMLLAKLPESLVMRLSRGV